MLRDNREHLDEIALFLLTKETITGEEFMAFLKEPDLLPEHEEAVDAPVEESIETSVEDSVEKSSSDAAE